MKKLLLILFTPFIVNAQQISVMDAVVLKEGSDADYLEIEEFWSKIHADIISQGKKDAVVNMENSSRRSTY